MRIIAFLLAFIVLALSCLPCADVPEAMKSGKGKIELVKTPAKQSNQDHNDDCSPFCSCACCAGLSLNHISASIASINFLQSRNFVSYLPFDIVEISLPIWQPPQLAL